MAAGTIIVPGAQPSRSRNGGAVVAELRFYANNTSTPKVVYADSGLTTPLPFPVVSDDAGRFVLIWAEAGPDDTPNLYTVNWSTEDGQSETYDDIRSATRISIAGVSSTGSVAADDVAVFVNSTTIKSGVPATVRATLSAASLAANTFTGKQTLPASATSAAPLNVPQGVAPTSPNNGDVWTTSAGLYARINGVTAGPFIQLSQTANPAWDLILQDEKASGTGAGLSAAGARQDRNISVVKRNTLGLTVTSTSFTITPGTWLIKGIAPCSGVGARLYVCDSAGNNDIGFGENALAAASTIGLSIAEGVITVASNTVMFLQQYTTAAVANGLGLPITTGGSEVYAKAYAKFIG